MMKSVNLYLSSDNSYSNHGYLSVQSIHWLTYCCIKQKKKCNKFHSIYGTQTNESCIFLDFTVEPLWDLLFCAINVVFQEGWPLVRDRNQCIYDDIYIQQWPLVRVVSQKGFHCIHSESFIEIETMRQRWIERRTQGETESENVSTSINICFILSPPPPPPPPCISCSLPVPSCTAGLRGDLLLASHQIKIIIRYLSIWYLDLKDFSFIWTPLFVSVQTCSYSQVQSGPKLHRSVQCF